MISNEEYLQIITSRRDLIKLGGISAGIGAIGQVSVPIAAANNLKISLESAQRSDDNKLSRSVMEKSLSRAGAVGDGKTLDTGAIQEAVAEVERNTRFEIDGSSTPFLGPGELVWPQGVFLVDDAIVITRSLRLRGEGQAEFSSGARIQQQRKGKDLFRVEPIAQGCSVGLSNLSLRANGGGATGGALLRVSAAAAGHCNSIRIENVVFGTPQTYAVNIERGDDVLISGCLFDVSGAQCVRLGAAAPGHRVSNARIVDSYFFAIAQTCIEAADVDGLIARGNNLVTNTTTRTFLYTPEKAKRCRNIVVQGNTLRNVDCFVDVTGVEGVVIDANIGDALGAGVSPRRAIIQCAGTCSGVVVTGNRLTGEATKGFYNDATATVTDAVIVGNSFAATGAASAALHAANTQGRIADNHIGGTARNSVGHRWTTLNDALIPGKIAVGTAATISLPVVGARPGDSVIIDQIGSVLPDGIVMSARADSETMTIRYANITNHPIWVGAHGVSAMVTR